MESVEGMDGKNHFKSGTSGFLFGWWSKPLLSLIKGDWGGKTDREKGLGIPEWDLA